jgi:DNA ligase-1
MRKPLEERIFYIQDLVASLRLPHVILPQYEVCRDTDHLQSALHEVISAGGQGLFLRQPGSLYDGKRSKTLLTVRPTLIGEAVLVNYEPGKGRLEGLVSALMVRSDTGLEFRVVAGLAEEMRRSPPPLGTKIRFQYQEKSPSGAPKCPVYLP